jgi:hypothetical protein
MHRVSGQGRNSLLRRLYSDWQVDSYDGTREAAEKLPQRPPSMRRSLFFCEARIAASAVLLPAASSTTSLLPAVYTTCPAATRSGFGGHSRVWDRAAFRPCCVIHGAQCPSTGTPSTSAADAQPAAAITSKTGATNLSGFPRVQAEFAGSPAAHVPPPAASAGACRRRNRAPVRMNGCSIM